MNVFMLNDGWADCGCGVPYTEGVFEKPANAISYVHKKDLQAYNEKRERYIKHHGTTKVAGGEEYPEFSAPAWRPYEDKETGLFIYTSVEGRWTIEEVEVQ